MDQICFVIRNFRRHRFRRDERIHMNFFPDWISLNRHGIVSNAVLNKFGKIWTPRKFTL